MSQSLCDGCGLRASDAHIARRIRRLELATSFRPIHIHLLWLADAPPARLEDYFYYPAKDPSEREGDSRFRFDALMQGLGIGGEAGKSDEAYLEEFQRRGFFLADACECPVDESAPGTEEVFERYAPTIVKRILYSYKPKHIALLSMRTRPLIPFLERAGLGDRLLLCQGLPPPFPWPVLYGAGPHPENSAEQALFCAGLREILEKLAAKGKTS